MAYYMGIDGGGSTLRVAITDDELTTKAYIERKETSNPIAVGAEIATQLIHSAVEIALQYAFLTPSDITAVSAGIAGAEAERMYDWLDGVLRQQFPHAHVVPSSDYEIALVGARAERYGVLILAGTGSVAFGVNREGQSTRVGGWGYMIGDEGSGYWIGQQAMRAITHAYDNRAQSTQLAPMILDHAQVKAPRDLVQWIYGDVSLRVKTVAALAPLVMQAAESGDAVALDIIQQAATHLHGHYNAILQRLNMSQAPVAFTGGLLEHDTILQRELIKKLNLTAAPIRQYEPVFGAAILARDTLKSHSPHEG